MATVYNQWSALFFKYMVFCNPTNKDEVVCWLLNETGHSYCSSRAPYTIVIDNQEKLMLVRFLEPEMAMRFKLMGF